MNNTKTLAEMIAVGCDWANETINETSFPADSARFVSTDLEIICLERSMTTKEVDADFEKRGLRHAVLEELLAYSAANRSMRLREDVFALGSWTGRSYRDFPQLASRGKERHLNLHGECGAWPEWTQLLVARK